MALEQDEKVSDACLEVSISAPKGREEQIQMEKITDKNKIIEIMDRPTHIDARNEGFRIHGEGTYPTALTMVGEDAILLYEYKI